MVYTKSSNTTHVSTTNFTRSNICRKKRKINLYKEKKNVVENFSYNKILYLTCFQ